MDTSVHCKMDTFSLYGGVEGSGSQELELFNPELKKLNSEFLQKMRSQGRSEKTILCYKRDLNKFWEWVTLNHFDFRNLTSKQVSAYVDKLIGSGLSAGTVNVALSCLKSFYEYLVFQDEVMKNPISTKFHRVNGVSKQVRYLKEVELKKVLKTLKKYPEKIELAFLTMLYAGLRVSEVAVITAEDVFTQQGRVVIRVRCGKGKKERYCPVVDRETASRLLRYKKKAKNDCPLFNYSAGTLQNYSVKIKKQSTVEEFSCHVMRHTFGTTLLAQGVPIDVIQEMMGHVSIDTTRRYSKTLPEKVLGIGAKVR